MSASNHLACSIAHVFFCKKGFPRLLNQSEGAVLYVTVVIRSFFLLFFSVRLLSFGLFISATTANDLRLRRIFYPRFYPLHLFSYLNSWEGASIFPLLNVQCLRRALLVPFLQRLWYDAILDWGLNPEPPALEASTIPLDYRGGGVIRSDWYSRWIPPMAWVWTTSKAPVVSLREKNHYPHC